MIGGRRHRGLWISAFMCGLLMLPIIISSFSCIASGAPASALFDRQHYDNKLWNATSQSFEFPSRDCQTSSQCNPSTRPPGDGYVEDKRKVHTGPNPLHNR
eukprot:Gb_20908 [translate_table: standard]